MNFTISQKASVFLLLLFLSSVSTSALSGVEKKNENSIGKAVEEAIVAIPSGRDGRRRTLNQLRKRLPNVSGEEKVFLQKLIKEVLGWKGKIPEKISFEGIEGLLKEYETSFAKTLKTRVQLSNLYESLYRSSPPGYPRKDSYMEKAVSHARSLVNSYPLEERAYAHYAYYQWKLREDPLDIIETYEKCLKALPTTTSCRQAIEQLAEEYQREFCPKKFLKKDLGIYLGRGDENRRKLSNNFQSEIPILKKEDIGSIFTRYDAKGKDLLQIILEPRASKRFADFTKENIGQRAVIYAGGKVLSAPKIMEEVVARDLLLSGATLADLCLQTEKRALPESVKKIVNR